MSFKNFSANVIFTIIAALLITCFSSSSLYAKSYRQREIKISAKINADGSLSIEESRTYDFRGFFSWADYRLPLKDLGQVVDFSLVEGNKLYLPAETHEPGTYSIRQTKDKFYVKWYYKAKDEMRTFTLRYKVTDVVNVYSDVAEFYYKFVSQTKPKAIARVIVDLSFPQKADTTNVRAWLHSSLNSFYYFTNGRIHFEASHLPKNRFFEVRAIFPPQWVANASKKFVTPRKNKILAQEKIFAERANEQRLKYQQQQQFKKTYAPKAKTFSFSAIIFGILLFLTLYNRYGKAHPVPGMSRISSEIPENITPAMANFLLLNGQISAGAITSTLLNFAAKGYLRIEEEVKEKNVLFFNYKARNQTLYLDRKKFEAEAYSSFQPHEIALIKFIFDDLGNKRDSITVAEIKKNRSKVMKWVRSWKKTIKQEWGNKPIWDKESLWATGSFAFYGLLITVLGILMTAYVTPFGFVTALAGILFTNLSFMLPRYTKEVKTIRTKLMALQKYLKKYEFRHRPGIIQQNFDRYLVYGIALGMGSRALRELVKMGISDPSQNYFPYLNIAGTQGAPDEISKSFSSLITSINSSMASASGTGGGASAGGGGGAGGASGGAG